VSDVHGSWRSENSCRFTNQLCSCCLEYIEPVRPVGHNQLESLVPTYGCRIIFRNVFLIQKFFCPGMSLPATSAASPYRC